MDLDHDQLTRLYVDALTSHLQGNVNQANILLVVSTLALGVLMHKSCSGLLADSDVF